MRRAEFVNDSGRSTGGQALRRRNVVLGMHGGTLCLKEEEPVENAVAEELSTPFRW